MYKRPRSCDWLSMVVSVSDNKYLMAALFLTLWTFFVTDVAYGQAQLADDIVILSKGLRTQEQARTDAHLGTSPGGNETRFRVVPGNGQARLSEPRNGNSMVAKDVLSAASAPPQARIGGGNPSIVSPPIRLPEELPVMGPLEIPSEVDEGPPDGLTLDAAIEALVRQNFDLNTKFQEIPKADADILSAGLRGNPLVFASADDNPYGRYSQQRPGENGYGVTIIQPIDANNKRRVRILAAQQAKRVLESQYQDAVRLEIDNLYSAYVDVLAAREGVLYVQASLAGLNEAVNLIERQVRGNQQTVIELDRVIIQRDSAQIALDEAKASLAKASGNLATLLNFPATEDQELAVKGRILSADQHIPRSDELVAMAIANRPDLMSYRLGVQRAQAEVNLAQAEATPDIFVLYTPYSLRNNTPTGGQDATSWSLGVMASVPLFNRNQGNIRRAGINVSQTRIEQSGLERQIENEVRRALKDHETASASVEKLKTDVLPRARRMRDQTLKLLTTGEQGAIAYLNAQREYSEVVRQYRDSLIRQRRAALRLNTVVALRIIR